MTSKPDTIRAAIIARADSLGLTAYAVAKQCAESFAHDLPTPSESAVKRYFRGIVSLNSRYVSQICAVLGLELRIDTEPRSAGTSPTF